MPRRPLLILLAAAAALRIVYYVEYTALPFLDAPLFDSVIYLHQAEAVRAGRLGDVTLLVFSPLYGYVLALLGPATVFVQLALGVLNVWLIVRLGQRHFGPRAGLVAGALYACYGVFMFYETKIMTETITMSLVLAILWLYQSAAFAQGRWGCAVGTGALFGASVLGRLTLAYSAPFFALAALLPWGTAADADWRPRLRRTAGFVAGLVLVLLGNGLRNQIHSGHFLPLVAREEARALPWDGTLRRYAAGDSHLVDIWGFVRRAQESLERPREAKRAFLGVDFSQFDPAAIARAAPSKLARLFSDTETTFQYGYYGERTEVRSLRLLPISFGCVLLLAAAGLAFLVRRDGAKPAVPFLPLVLGAMATAVFAIPEGRYRMPMLLPLLLLAGHAAVRVAEIADRRRRALAAAALLLPCLFFAHRTVTYQLSRPAMWHLRVAEAEAKRGDLAAVRARVGAAHRLAPDDLEVQDRIRYVLRRAGLTPPP